MENSHLESPAAHGHAESPRLSARERLLDAAGELFYEHGVQSVGIEKVIERAGVAKASLYSNFKGKDDLVRAYLLERQVARQARAERVMGRYDNPRDKMLAIYEGLAEAFSEPTYKGCAFMRAAAQISPESRAREVVDSSRTWTLELFTGLAREAGCTAPEALAGQLVLLYDGAMVSAQMDHNLAAAQTARALAASLIDAARGGKAVGGVRQ
jgi:AcrR family transcriptional regulator